MSLSHKRNIAQIKQWKAWKKASKLAEYGEHPYFAIGPKHTAEAPAVSDTEFNTVFNIKYSSNSSSKCYTTGPVHLGTPAVLASEMQQK